MEKQDNFQMKSIKSDVLVVFGPFFATRQVLEALLSRLLLAIFSRNCCIVLHKSLDFISASSPLYHLKRSEMCEQAKSDDPQLSEV